MRSDATAETLYLHRDHLGSVDAITDAGGNLEERYSYDAFGKRRQLAWTPDTADVLLYSTIQIEDRGYTGHEQLDHVGLIHMNGRVYDPIVGRFTSADPFVQFPESTQGLNRYTYVNNSPLSYTDPSGFFSFGDLFKALINPAILVNEYIIENPRESLAIGLMVVPGGQILGVQSALAGFAVATAQGFAAGMVAGRGDLRAGLMGAATAGAFYGVGSAFQGMKGGAEGSFWGTGLTRGEFAGKVIVHGAVGGAASDWYGGSFSEGFLGAATAQTLSPGIEGVFGRGQDLRAARIGAAGLIGGTAAAIGGGKFANGAITAAFARAFNHEHLSKRQELNRADFENIADEAGRLRRVFKNDRIDGLVRENPHLRLIDNESVLQDALMVAQTDVTFYEGQARLQAGLEVGRHFAFPGVPGGGLLGGIIDAISSVFSAGSLLFPPQASGQVAIPCGTSGCDVFVGDRQVEFTHGR